MRWAQRPIGADVAHISALEWSDAMRRIALLVISIAAVLWAAASSARAAGAADADAAPWNFQPTSGAKVDNPAPSRRPYPPPMFGDLLVYLPSSDKSRIGVPPKPITNGSALADLYPAGSQSSYKSLWY